MVYLCGQELMKRVHLTTVDEILNRSIVIYYESVLISITK